jgi:hypothetical protein
LAQPSPEPPATGDAGATAIKVDTRDKPVIVGTGLDAHEVEPLTYEERERRRMRRSLVMMVVGILLLVVVLAILVNR